MKRLQTIDQGVLYCNPRPAYVAEGAIHPRVITLGPDHLLCVFRTGQAMYSNDGKIAVVRSRDAGKTWQYEGPIAWPQSTWREFTYGIGWAAVHHNGSIVLGATRYRPYPDDVLRFNPVTGGVRPGDEQVWSISKDQGKTWTDPVVIPISYQEITSTHAGPIEVAGGRWMQIIETWNDWADTRPLHIKGFAVFSPDRGKTWTKRVDFPSAVDQAFMYSHSQYRKLPDGRIAATQWKQSVGGAENYDLHLTIGSRDGTNWTLPAPTGLQGQSSAVAGLPDGSLVVTYSLREGKKPGVMVALSRDGGKTWDLDTQVLVWDAAGSDYLGGTHHVTYPASHDNIAFGKPDTEVLPSGEVISSWWCLYGGIVHLRYARLKVA